MQLQLLPVLVVSLAGLLSAQETSVRGTVEVLHSSEAASGNADVVVWLTPAQGASSFPSGQTARLLQKGKKFIPHVVGVTQGTEIEFPNQDLFFHNVFSIHQGKTIDLGLYESGAARKVRFTQTGISYIFCNIHPEMSAVVVALNSPYYAISDRAGNVSIAGVPDGNYELHVWYERSLPEELKGLTRSVMLSSSSHDLGVLTIPEDSGSSLSHKNKFGQDYTPPPAQGYSKP